MRFIYLYSVVRIDSTDGSPFQYILFYLYLMIQLDHLLFKIENETYLYCTTMTSRVCHGVSSDR